MIVKPVGLLRPQSTFIQYGLYNKSQFDDLVNNQNLIPIATTSEFNNLRNSVSQTMGSGSPYEGTYTTGLDKKYVIYQPIDLTSIANFTPYASYAQTFDGNEVAVTNLNINNASTFVGLFGTVSGMVKNLWVSGDVQSTNVAGLGTGGVCASLSGTTENCRFNGTVTSASQDTGGIVGSMTGSGTVGGCRTTGTIDGTTRVGGIVGRTNDVLNVITECRSSMDATGTTNWVGGIIGRNDGATISECFATGNAVSGTVTAGGFVGYNQAGTISNCYATGNASGPNFNGGFSGANDGTIDDCYSIGVPQVAATYGGFSAFNGGTITNSYWDTVTSGVGTSAGGTGKTTTEMHNGAIPDVSIYVGWSASIWNPVDNSNYPILINNN